MSLPLPNSCLSNLYYGTEELTGITDLLSIPEDEATQVQIISEIRNSVCGVIANCSECRATAGCGWCPDIGYCLEGNPSGPIVGTCTAWRYGTDLTENRVVAWSGFGNPVHPATIDVFLVSDDNPVTVYFYTVFPEPTYAVQIHFLVDLSKGMADALRTFQGNCGSMFDSLQVAYPNSGVAVSWFSDRGVLPFGNPKVDFAFTTATSFITSNKTIFVNEVQSLLIKDGADEPNSQLDGLLHVALRSPSMGFTDTLGAHHIVVLITGTSYHTPPNIPPLLIPNNLDDVVNKSEDYPYVVDVRAALINSNFIPIVVVVEPSVVPNYTELIKEIGFGVVMPVASPSSIPDAVLNGIKQAFTTATMVASNTTYITRIDPGVAYTSMQPKTRVQFAVTVDKKAMKKRSVVEFYDEVVVTVPGFGQATIRLTNSDAPTGIDIHAQGKENTPLQLQLNADNVYNTGLDRQILSLPGNGTLLQFDTRKPIMPGDFLTDPNGRVVFVPAPNGSCQSKEVDYCSRKRFLNCNNPCPYATFEYAVVDKCSARSANVSVAIDIFANVTNNQPKALLPSSVSGCEDKQLNISLLGSDADNDPLTAIITAIPGPKQGILVDPSNGNITITSAMLPYTAPTATIAYIAPYHSWGANITSFTYYLNDGHPDYELGNSAPLTVSITMQLTDHAPQVKDQTYNFYEDPELPTTWQSVLPVTDADAVDYADGELTVQMLDFPNSSVGYFQQADLFHNITVDQPFVTISPDLSWTFYFIINAHVFGVFSFRYISSPLLLSSPL